MTPKEYLKNKKVLVMGLGLLGGGIAATKWLVKHGAKVTVTDLKPRLELADSIKALGATAKKVKFVLGRHQESDFKNNQIIVVNPAVPKESPYLKIARKAGAALENEASLFFRFCRNPTIGVTGTRGKTTTANWTAHLLRQKYPRAAAIGNSSDNPMLNALDKLDGQTPVVVELSSWHLELLPQSKKSLPRGERQRVLRGPHIAVITNLYPDHLNRYKNIREYAMAKANIFKRQTPSDFLILNKNNKWTLFFLKQKPTGQILFAPFPLSPISPPSPPLTSWGEHNLQNLAAAALAANTASIGWGLIKKAARTLPQLKFREETIYQRGGLAIINDAVATSPDAAVAALKRFSPQCRSLILITGGTDKKLDFKEWAGAVKKYVKPGNLFLLDGSATGKMIETLNKTRYFGRAAPRLFLGLETLLISTLKHAKSLKGKTIVLFSPGSASFEKFKNEFDRGEKFNRLVKKLLKRGEYR